MEGRKNNHQMEESSRHRQLYSVQVPKYIERKHISKMLAGRHTSQWLEGSNGAGGMPDSPLNELRNHRECMKHLPVYV